MASIHHELVVNVSADKAWSALRQVDQAHKLFAPVLVDGHMEGDVRTVTFANGLVTRERIIDISDDRRRVAYSVIEGAPLTHHNASMQIAPIDERRCRFIWIADFLPHDFTGAMAPLVKQGAEALKANLESEMVDATGIEPVTPSV
jgi:hypothetical protein